MSRKINPLKFAAGIAILFLFSGKAFGQSEKLYQPKNDTLFSKPYIDVDEWREKPVHHRYVHGGFKGTLTKFSFYFPAKEQYQGHFFQYVTPFPDSETLSQGASGEEDKIGFSIVSGAYFVETNGGGRLIFPNQPWVRMPVSVLIRQMRHQPIFQKKLLRKCTAPAGLMATCSAAAAGHTARLAG